MDYGQNATINTVDTPAEFGNGPAGEVRRWMVELQLAKTRMKDWRDGGRKLWDQYQASKRKKNSYNALYTNTEILAPAVYNSLPTPDVRRRFGDEDPIGKAVSQVLSRALTFNMDTADFDPEIRADVLDMLIVGRGISRVRYVPDLVSVGDTMQTGIEADETQAGHAAQEGEQNEELAWETAPIEHVKWDMYLCGPGRSFKEIPWWAFKHDLNREELVKRFGEECGNAIPLNGGPADPTLDRIADDSTLSLFKTAEVWEIWDGDSRKVLWICENYPKEPCKTEDDPLELDRFFPVVDPLRAIEDSDTFEPTPLYEQYREQAEELDRISARINKLVVALKVRAIYDPALGTQISELFRGDDNDLIPADQSIKGLYENGGLANSIWFAPIDQIVKVVESLYKQREECKQVIFELTGIADIMRGSTDPGETYGAQALKTAFGMTRLSKMQRAVQRYIRDLINLQSEVICVKFGVDTLKQMTQVKLPTDAEVMPQRLQMMQQAVMAKLAGQDVPPLPPKPLTWEDVTAAMKNDALRAFKVDIETDSTIAAIQQEDMQDLQAVMGAIGALMKEMWPLVQNGSLPLEAAKQLLLTIARKSRMGSAVEDALDQIQQPQPQPDKDAQKLQAQGQQQMQVEQLRQQGKQQEIAANLQAERERAQLDAQVAMAEQHAQALQSQHQNELEAQRDALAAQQEAALERMRMQNQSALEQMKAEMQANLQVILAAMNNQRAIEVAEIAADAQLDAAQISAARAGTEQ